MKQLLKRILNKPFIRHVTVLVTGTAAAQLIALISSPIITRLYGPEAFGVMGVFMGIIQIIMPVVSLTYPIAIVLPKNDRNAKRIAKLSIIIALVFSLITLIIILLFNHSIINIFRLHEVSSYLLLIPIVIIFSGLTQVANQWLIRTHQFAINAKASFYQSLIINSGKIGVGFVNPTATALILLSSVTNGLRAFIIFFLM